MNLHINKASEKSRSLAADTSVSAASGSTALQLKDNRPQSAIKEKQAKALSNKAPDKKPVQKKANNTGLPDNLKSGIENLSGHAMDDVKVHYNSAQPAQLNAHAYAQGSAIHLAPGQEKHLPHEAWHVVQQKQGRVRPTMQLKGKLNVNDDKGLEKEADVMGAKAVSLKKDDSKKTLKQVKPANKTTRQAKFVGGGAGVLKALLHTAPAVYTELYSALEASASEITINMVSGGQAMNFNYADNSINLNGTLVGQAIAARTAKEAGWESTMAFVYSSASHELQHAHDRYISNMQFLTGKMGSLDEILPLYYTELNAWASEARADLELGNSASPLLNSWFTVHPGVEAPGNMIWARLKQYTDGSFKSRWPDGWTWDAKAKSKLLAHLSPKIAELQAKLQAQFKSLHGASGSGSVSSSSSISPAPTPTPKSTTSTEKKEKL